MTIRVGYIISVLLLFGGSGCSSDESHKYFPEHPIGSQCTFELTITAFLGTFDGTGVITVEGEEVIDGKTYQKQQAIFEFKGLGQHSETEYTRLTDEGVYTRKPEKEEYLEYAFPVEEGKAWSVESPEGILECTYEGYGSALVSGRVIDDALTVSCKGTQAGRSVKYKSIFAGELGLVRTTGNLGAGNMDVRLKECS